MADYYLKEMFSRNQVLARTKQLAGEIYPDFAGFDTTLVILALGGMRFGVDLFDGLASFPDLEKTLRLNSMGITSYTGEQSNGKPVIYQNLKKPEILITGRHILLVDDIRHTSGTLDNTAIPHIEKFNPKSLSVATLISAEGLPSLNISGKTYTGFYMNKDKYVVGELLDKDEDRRGVKGIQEVIFEN